VSDNSLFGTKIKKLVESIYKIKFLSVSSIVSEKERNQKDETILLIKPY